MFTVKNVEVGDRIIGPGHPCFIIAEAGVNHNGDHKIAEKMINIAADAGVDAIKFQTFKAEALVSSQAPKAAYQFENTNAEESQLEMLKKLELSQETHTHLLKLAEQRGLVFLSTPFDEESADFLENLGMALYKIASGELTNFPLLEHIARKGKPMIVSTGMAYLSEVEEALEVISKAGCRSIVLLHCTSNYPANPSSCNLRAMVNMGQACKVPVGYSDHTEGHEISVAAVSLGASVLEKHFTLNRDLPGPDHRASLEPGELKQMVHAVRRVEEALGNGIKVPVSSEQDTRAVARRSLVAARALPVGTILEARDLDVKRPGTGIPPSEVGNLIGRTLTRSLPTDEIITWKDVE